MQDFFNAITVEDVIFAAFWSLFFTYIINVISRVSIKIVKMPAGEDINILKEPKVRKLIESLHALYPQTTFRIKGAVYTRGMIVKILTNKHSIIVGEIIGKNDDGILCLATSKNIVMQETSQIEEITFVGKLNS